MPAVVSLRVNTGTNAGTESGAQTGIDFISADNALNTLANRQANPIQAGDNSFEKWLTLKIDTPPDNYIENVQAWTDGNQPHAEIGVMVGVTATGVTPTAATSTVATTDFFTYVTGSRLTWHAGQLSAQDAVTDFMVLQMQVTASAPAGNVGQETFN